MPFFEKLFEFLLLFQLTQPTTIATTEAPRVQPPPPPPPVVAIRNQNKEDPAVNKPPSVAAATTKSEFEKHMQSATDSGLWMLALGLALVFLAALTLMYVMLTSRPKKRID